MSVAKYRQAPLRKYARWPTEQQDTRMSDTRVIFAAHRDAFDLL